MGKRVTTFEFELFDFNNQIEEALRDYLDMDEGDMTITYVVKEVGCDPLGRSPGRHEVTEVKVRLEEDI